MKSCWGKKVMAEITDESFYLDCIFYFRLRFGWRNLYFFRGNSYFIFVIVLWFIFFVVNYVWVTTKLVRTKLRTKIYSLTLFLPPIFMASQTPLPYPWQITLVFNNYVESKIQGNIHSSNLEKLSYRKKPFAQRQFFCLFSYM